MKSDFDKKVWEDRDYWQNIATKLGLRLYGWTENYSATFFYGKFNQTISIDAELAEILLSKVGGEMKMYYKEEFELAV